MKLSFENRRVHKIGLTDFLSTWLFCTRLLGPPREETERYTGDDWMNSDVTEVRLTMWRQSAYAQDLVCSHIDEQIGNAFKNVTIERKYKLHANVCTRKCANKFPAHYRVPAQYIYGNEMDRPDRLGITNFLQTNIIFLGFNSSLSILHISILLGERVIKRAQSPSTPNNGRQLVSHSTKISI